MLFSVCYELLMWLVFIAFLPKAIYQAISQKKYRKSTSRRFGFQFPKVERKGSGPIFWVHAVSVGETQAIASFVKRIKREISDATFVISSVTETAHETAKRALPDADYHVFLPFDFYFSVKHTLSLANPDVVILCETDFWWRFLYEAKKLGAVAMLVNGKISERSCNNFKRAGFFAKRLFGLIDFYCLQSEEYKKRFLSLGVPASKIKVTGNIKGDVQFSSLQKDEIQRLKESLGFAKDDLVLVVGSTHDPEELLILQELKPLLEKYAHFKLVIVPRHPNRFSEVANLIANSGLENSSWTKLESGLKSSPKVVLVDAMGALIKCYQIADLAIVAGSFTERVGGHNILEPCYFGVPTLCGPYMHTQQQLLDTAHHFGAIVQVDEKNLQKTVDELIANPQKRKDIGQKGLVMMTTLRGATDRTIDMQRMLTPQFFSSGVK